MSSKILAAVMALGLLTAGSGAYAYSLLTTSPSSGTEPAAVEISTTEDTPSPCTSQKSCCCQ